MAQSLSGTSELDVKSEVDKEIVSEGEILTYTITITGTKATDVDVPDFGKKIGDFPVVDSSTHQRTEGNKKIFEHWYKLRAGTPGTYTLPGVILSYKHNNKKMTTETQQVNIIVVAKEEQKKTSRNSAQEMQSEDIKDIKSLEKIEVPLSWYITGSSIIAFIIIAGILITYFIKKKHKKIQPAPSPVPPHQAAHEALKLLKQSTYLDSGQYKVFHYKLSEIFRNYLEARYSFPATDLTTDEILPYAQKMLNMSEQGQKTLKNVLYDTDFVKFSDMIPTKERSLELLNSVETFIEETYKQIDRADQGGMRHEV
jgi:hypothetical protein